MAGPEAQSLTSGNVPMRMSAEEVQKYMRLREQNPTWNKFSTVNEDTELKEEYMKQMTKTDEKNADK